jgi:hypothetical protein
MTDDTSIFAGASDADQYLLLKFGGSRKGARASWAISCAGRWAG